MNNFEKNKLLVVWRRTLTTTMTTITAMSPIEIAPTIATQTENEFTCAYFPKHTGLQFTVVCYGLSWTEAQPYIIKIIVRVFSQQIHPDRPLFILNIPAKIRKLQIESSRFMGAKCFQYSQYETRSPGSETAWEGYFLRSRKAHSVSHPASQIYQYCLMSMRATLGTRVLVSCLVILFRKHSAGWCDIILSMSTISKHSARNRDKLWWKEVPGDTGGYTGR